MIEDRVAMRKEDVKMVAFQLGGKKVSASNVVRRCVHGCPVLVTLSPVAVREGAREFNFTALSNILWLTCPELNKHIHALESQGGIDAIDGLINGSAALRAKMDEAHAHYCFLRKNIITQYWKHEELPFSPSKLYMQGIGGLADTAKLKCLHLHYAHYLVCGSNYAGKIIDGCLGGAVQCADKKCRMAIDE